MRTVKFGTLYFNGGPVPAGTRNTGEQIGFGNTVPRKAISFIRWNNLYIADRCVCTNISWVALDKQGFIFGRPVRVDGKAYLCRAPRVGAREEDPNEWDDFVSVVGKDDKLLHWKDMFFLGQETSLLLPKDRVVRGYSSADDLNSVNAEYRGEFIGFRPVFEPLPPEAPVSEALVGHGIKVYGKRHSIVGRLTGYDAYDLELTADSPIPENCTWIRQVEHSVFVDRNAVAYLHKEEKKGWKSLSLGVCTLMADRCR